MKILANLLDLTNATATLDNLPFNGYTFEFKPTGELENTFLWRNGHKLNMENNPLSLPKQPLIVEASHLEEIELPNEEFEYHFQGTPFTGTAIFFIEGKLVSEETFRNGSGIDPIAKYHPTGTLSLLDQSNYCTRWFTNGVIESQYSPPNNELQYLIQYDKLGSITTLSFSVESALDYPLIQSKKFGHDATLVGNGVTNNFLLSINRWGALQDTKKLKFRKCAITVDGLIQTSLENIEMLSLSKCPNIDLKDIEILSNLYPNLRFDTEYL